MKNPALTILAIAFAPAYALAVDGVVLINQSTVMAAGGFPYVISQPGSYRLSGNLTVPDANTNAIMINAVGVTLDLNGFSIIGPTVCTGFPATTSCSPTGTGNGIIAGNAILTGLATDITVANGTVRGMGSRGIDLDGVSGVTVEKVRASSNGIIGILVGFNSLIAGSIANNNGLRGIQNFQGILSGNIADGNKETGIIANCPSTVIGNQVTNNGSSNLFINGPGCVAVNNVAP